MSRKAQITSSTEAASSQKDVGLWPEWSDVDLNSEPWDFPKGGFTDHHKIILPRSLECFEWKRFAELIFVDSPIVNENNSSSYPDLVSKNQHIMQSEFVRCFISTLINLQYCGHNGLEIENPGNNFSWTNFENERWQGWFHIYALNNAGKEIPHRPVYNPNGRYVARIFYMGCWRKIMVDDLVPVDSRGKPLLPRTSNVNEIWPIILAKALLKIVALSSTEKREIVDCSLITCLTGWIDLSLDVSHLSCEDQWNLVVKYTKRFESPPAVIEGKGKSEGQEKSTRGRKLRSKSVKSEVPEDPESPIKLFLSIFETRNIQEDEIPGITPCWNHQIYAKMSRDVPLDPKKMKIKGFARWKEIRWFRWAMERGMIDGTDYLVPMRRLLVVSPLGKWTRTVLCGYDEDLEEKGSSESSLESEGKKVKTEKATAASNESLGGKYETSKNTKDSDISLWTDFNKLSKRVERIDIIYREKCFKRIVEISRAVEKMTLSKEGKKRKSELFAREPKKQIENNGRNVERINIETNDEGVDEDLYIFIDSEESTFFLVNFSIFPKEEKDETDKTEDGNGDDREEKKNGKDKSMKKSSLTIERENYFETEEKDEGAVILNLRTRGSRSMVFELEPGRHLLRITASRESKCRALLLSNDTFVIGNRRKMHECMTSEALRIKNFAKNIENCLKKAFESFGTPEYPSELKKFRESYRPDSPQGAQDRISQKSIDDLFLKEIVKLVEKNRHPNDLMDSNQALRIFFRDPSIGRRKYSEDIEEKIIFQNEIDQEKKRKLDVSSSIIQRLFRKFLIICYEKRHDRQHEDHQRVKENLRKILELLNDEKKDESAIEMLRNMTKLGNVRNFYSWTKDANNVIEIREFIGKLRKATRDDWTPIGTIQFNIKERARPVFYLFTSFQNHSIRVFENDEGREVSLTHGRASLEPRRRGYTLFAYARNNIEKSKETECSIQIVTIKGESNFYNIDGAFVPPGKFELGQLTVNEIHDVYVPNYRNLIFRLLIKIKNSQSPIFLRLRTSYDKVMTSLRVVDGEKVLSELKAGSVAILSLVNFQHGNSDQSNEDLSERSRESSLNMHQINSKENISFENNIEGIMVEALVRNNSWPLDPIEWSVALESATERSKNLSDNVPSRKSSREKNNSRSKNFTNKFSSDLNEWKKPYWCLQIISEPDNHIEIIRDDKKREGYISKLKEIWEKDEPARSERGKSLRRRFIEENSSSMVPSVTDSETPSSHIKIETKVDELENDFSVPSERTHKPPLNYLGYSLPKFDLAIFMEKEDEEEDRWVKTEFDEETLRNQRAINLFDFQHLHNYLVDESLRFLEKRTNKYNQAELKYSENRINRDKKMSQIYEARKIYVESTKDTARSGKSKDTSKPK